MPIICRRLLCSFRCLALSWNTLPPLPTVRQLAWLLCQDAEKWSAEDQALVEQLQQHPELTHVQQLVQQGAAMIRQRQAAALDAWLRPVKPARAWSYRTSWACSNGTMPLSKPP